MVKTAPIEPNYKFLKFEIFSLNKQKKVKIGPHGSKDCSCTPHPPDAADTLVFGQKRQI